MLETPSGDRVNAQDIAQLGVEYLQGWTFQVNLFQCLTTLIKKQQKNLVSLWVKLKRVKCGLWFWLL